MKRLIELGAVRIGDVCGSIDFDVLSLPGGSLIAVLLWLNATAAGSIRRASTSRRSNDYLRHAGLRRQSGAMRFSVRSYSRRHRPPAGALTGAAASA